MKTVSVHDIEGDQCIVSRVDGLDDEANRHGVVATIRIYEGRTSTTGMYQKAAALRIALALLKFAGVDLVRAARRVIEGTGDHAIQTRIRWLAAELQKLPKDGER